MFNIGEAFSFQIAPTISRDRPLLERHRRQWRPGRVRRLVQGQVGHPWQITRGVLTDAMAAGGAEQSAPSPAMMDMRRSTSRRSRRRGAADGDRQRA